MRIKCMEVQAVPILLSHLKVVWHNLTESRFECDMRKLHVTMHGISRCPFNLPSVLISHAYLSYLRIFGPLCNYQTVHNWLENAFCFVANYGFDQVIDDKHSCRCPFLLRQWNWSQFVCFERKKKTVQVEFIESDMTLTVWIFISACRRDQYVPGKSDLEHKCTPSFRYDWICCHWQPFERAICALIRFDRPKSVQLYNPFDTAVARVFRLVTQIFFNSEA